MYKRLRNIVLLIILLPIHLFGYDLNTKKNLEDYVFNPKSTNFEKIVKFDSLLANAKKNNRIDEIILIKINYGTLLKNNGFFDRALQFVSEAKETANSNNLIELKADALLALGEVCRAINKFDVGRQVLQEAESIYFSFKDSVGLAKTYGRLSAIAFQEWTRAVQSTHSIDSVQFRKSAIEFLDKSNSYALKLNLNNLIMENYILLGAIYRTEHKYDSSKAALNFAENLYIKHKELESNLASLYWNFALLYNVLNDFESTVYYAKTALSYSEKFDYKGIIRFTSRLLYEVYYKRGDFKNSVKYLEISDHYHEIIFTENLGTTTFLLQSKYEEEKQEIERKKDKEFWIYILIIVLSLALVIILTIYRDNKKQKSLNAELKRLNEINVNQNDKLNALNSTKDKFFSIIAHDLKNPLSAVIQSSNILEEMKSELNEEEKTEFISSINVSSKRLYNLLENLLTWARSQRGSIKFEPVQIQINLLVESITQLFKKQAEDKSLEFLINIPSGIEITADSNMFMTILRNLISNAIKFSNQGSKIEILFEESGDYYKFGIKDNGLGISNSDINKLFRIEISHTSIGSSGEKGTGLGLIICKEFVEKHSGKIWVESEINIGSTFYFTISKNIKSLDM